MTRDAHDAFLRFATAADATWPGNFRDLSAAVRRMATLATGARITIADVEHEVARLRAAWAIAAPPAPLAAPPMLTAPPLASATPAPGQGAATDDVDRVLGERAADLDLVDRAQLAVVLRVCRESASLSDAGRRLYAASRTRKTSTNDADRLRKYLARWGLTWPALGTTQGPS